MSNDLTGKTPQPLPPHGASPGTPGVTVPPNAPVPAPVTDSPAPNRPGIKPTEIGVNPSLFPNPNTPEPGHVGKNDEAQKETSDSSASGSKEPVKSKPGPKGETEAPENSPPLRKIVSEAKQMRTSTGELDPLAITVYVKAEEDVSGGSKYGLFSLNGKNNKGDSVSLGSLEPFLGMYPNLWIVDEHNKVSNISTTETKQTPNRFMLYFDQPLPNTLSKGRQYELHTSNPT